MMQTSKPLAENIPLCGAGHHPQWVETRGAPAGHAVGAPCPPMFHIECHRCGMATVPSTNRALPELRWTDPANPHRVAISELRRARQQASAALANVA